MRHSTCHSVIPPQGFSVSFFFYICKSRFRSSPSSLCHGIICWRLKKVFSMGSGSTKKSPLWANGPSLTLTFFFWGVPMCQRKRRLFSDTNGLFWTKAENKLSGLAVMLTLIKGWRLDGAVLKGWWTLKAVQQLYAASVPRRTDMALNC